MSKRTLVIGASENPSRYSNRAIKMLKTKGHEVVALAQRPGMVEGITFQTDFPDDEIHTVTLYVGPQRQSEYYADIVNLKPQRVLFNPGTENPEFEKLLEEKGIESENACTLVLLSLGSY